MHAFHSRPKLTALAAAAALTIAAPAHAAGGFELNAFEPAPAGDVFLGVPSPFASGHVELRGYLMYDHAAEPLRSSDELVPVSAQGFVRLDVSLALWERLLVSADAPLAVVQDGDATAPGAAAPGDAPGMGDLRLGVRGRVLGEDNGPVQLGVGGYLFVPTGEQERYLGEGMTRGALHAVLGGRAGDDVGFVYTAAGGVELRGANSPHALTYGAGLALLLGGELAQLGAELYGSTALGDELALLETVPVSEAGTSAQALTVPAPPTAEAGSNVEVLFAGKLRVLDGLTFGAAAGPGLVDTAGTPTFRAVGVIGWTPLAQRRRDDGVQVKAERGADRDADAIPDELDACPAVAGEPAADPALDGCPPRDRDSDGIIDPEDACPTAIGARSARSDKNGCPDDRDRDGIADPEDACSALAGPASAEPTSHGCPTDRDADGVADGEDACLYEAGRSHADPRRHGCPSRVHLTDGELVLDGSIEFDSHSPWMAPAVARNSEPLLEEVKEVLLDPGVVLVEVQGHTDDSGDAAFNLILSERRAETVRRWLVDHGAPIEKLRARGYGSERPIADNRLRVGRAKNRRVQLTVVTAPTATGREP